MNTGRIVLVIAVGLMAVTAIQWRQNQTLQRELVSVRNQLAQANAVKDTQKSVTERNDPRVEDFRSRIGALSNRVAQLETELARTRRAPGQAATAETTRSQAPVASQDEMARQLTDSLLSGDFIALDTLTEMARQATETHHPNMTPEEQESYLAKLRPLWEAFDALAKEASQGNTNALQALANSARMPELSGLAAKSLGKLAGAGSDGALNIILDPDRFGLDIPLAGRVQALRPAAEDGNARAIEALAALAQDDEHQALWFMAAEALGNAAQSGDAVAIGALVSFSRSTNQNVMGAVRRGLGAAAANQNATAIEALHRLDAQQLRNQP
jgi:hypothetical protein